MPIRSIEKIKIGNYPEGKFGEGYIYSAQVTQGYAEEANKLTIDIVTNKGDNLILPSKNLTTSYRVQFGDIILPKLYFISHTKEISVDQEITTCVFVDDSILLDRYYVGLTNRHYKVAEQNQTFNLSVNCANCDGIIGAVNGTVTRSLANSPNILVNNLLVVGDEEFIDQNCDVPDVKYNFTDLLTTMAKISNFSFENFSDINPSYKNSYTGTLREVLSNWCSDFGFSFYWDFLKNSLICIDLRNPVDLDPVNNFISQNFDNNSNLPISNYSEEETLEGTYQQDNIDYILKPARNKEKAIKDFFSITYVECEPSIGLNDIEMTLAKYNPQAFSLYSLMTSQFSNIGFTFKYRGIESYVLSKVLQNVYEFSLDGRASIVLGYYRRDIEEDIINRGSQCAEDMGKYYSNTSYVKWNELNCTSTSKYEINATYEPPPLTTLYPWDVYNGKGKIAGGGVVWLIQRNPVWNAETDNFSIDDLGPIYVDIDGEVADQVRDALLLLDPNDINADRYRGLTLIAYKPYLNISTDNNIWNSAEETFFTATYNVENPGVCQTLCEKDAALEICRKDCTYLEAPAHGLVSKFSKSYNIRNNLNGTEMNIILPSRQNYIGYIKAEGTFTYTEPGVKIMQNKTNFVVNQNVMNYSINLNDVTEDEPSLGQVNFQDVDQNSDNLNIVQKNPKKSISLKIIGMNYGSLSQYLNPQAGLKSFNVYLNDNGTFTDLVFENRPAEKPKGEVIMQKVGPQKVRITK